MFPICRKCQLPTDEVQLDKNRLCKFCAEPAKAADSVTDVKYNQFDVGDIVHWYDAPGIPMVVQRMGTDSEGEITAWCFITGHLIYPFPFLARFLRLHNS